MQSPESYRENTGTLRAIVFALLVWPAAAFADGGLSVAAQRPSFDPARGGSVLLAMTLPEAGTASLAIYDLSHRRVKTLADGVKLPAGQHAFTWAGETDGGGRAGGGQAFVPVATLVTASGSSLAYDPAAASGGEPIPMSLLDVQYDPARKAVSYEISRPARVRLRAGVRQGPLLKTILEWAPKVAGRYSEPWDGQDETGTIDLASRQDTMLVPSAFALPEGAIVTGGPPAESTGVSAPKGKDADRANRIRAKAIQSKTAIDAHALTAGAVETLPRFTIEILGATAGAGGLPAVKGRAGVRVLMDGPTAESMLRDRFEIVVHVDMTRIFEEEQGYNPYTIEFPTGTFAPGEHVLSVSVASLADRISTVSQRFAIER